jgi:hypothetical protein
VPFLFTLHSAHYINASRNTTKRQKAFINQVKRSDRDINKLDGTMKTNTKTKID